jgi:large subunit ribosomal protein L29
MIAAELREKTVAELQQELKELLREQFNLRMQKGSGQVIKPHLFQRARRAIARINTIIQEKDTDVKARTAEKGEK